MTINEEGLAPWLLALGRRSLGLCWQVKKDKLIRNCGLSHNEVVFDKLDRVLQNTRSE